MALIEIEGVGPVEVDDSFLQLSPEEQEAVANQIAEQVLGTSQGSKPTNSMIAGMLTSAGRIATGTTKTFDQFANWLGRQIPMGGPAITENGLEVLSPEEYRKLQESGNTIFGEAVRRGEEDLARLNWQPTVDWNQVKSDPTLANIGQYAFEQGVVSIPDMVAATRNPAGYFLSRTGDLAEERARADNRNEITGSDLLIGGATSAAMTALERFGGRGIVQNPAKTFLGRVISGGKREAGEEFAEGLIEEFGTTAGTETGFDLGRGLDRGFAGAVAGGPYGGAFTGAVDVGRRIANVPRLARESQARREYSSNPEQIASDLRVADLYDQMRESQAKADTGTEQPADVTFKKVQDRLKGQLIQAINTLYDSGQITAEARAELLTGPDALIKQAGQHNRDLSEMDFDRVRRLGLDPVVERGLLNAFRDLNTASFAGMKKNAIGPLERAAGFVATAAGGAAGSAVGGPLGTLPGSLAGQLVSGGFRRVGRNLDNILRTQEPDILRRAQVRREVMRKLGQNYGDTEHFMQDLQANAEAGVRMANTRAAQMEQDAKMLSRRRRLENLPADGGFEGLVYDRTGLLPDQQDTGLLILAQQGIITPEQIKAFLDRPRSLMRENQGNIIIQFLNDLADRGRLKRDPRWVSSRPQSPQSETIPTGGGTEGIRNIYAYRQTMRNVQQATDNAMASAPTPELAAVASRVANARTKPLKRAVFEQAMVEHPEHAQWLNDVVRPMTEFGPAAVEAGDGDTGGASLDIAPADDTNSPLFKAWFGNSKVVDEKGRPLVVYHGTASAVDEFERTADGSFYFTDSPDVAADFGAFREYVDYFDDTTTNVVPVYLSIQNPLYADLEGEHLVNVEDDLIAEAKAKGHDGVIVQNAVVDSGVTYTPEGPDGRRFELGAHLSPGGDTSTVYIVFDNKQIKSKFADWGGVSFAIGQASRDESGTLVPPESSALSGKIRKKDGSYRGSPANITSPAALGHLRKTLLNLAREGKPGRFWYERSGRAILNAVGGDKAEAEKIAQLIGIFSTGTPVWDNFNYAIQAYLQHKAGRDIMTGRFPTRQVKLAKEVLNGKPWNGRKTNNFYVNLMREIDPSAVQGVTVDVWMMRAFGFTKPDGSPFEGDPTDAQYDFVEREVKRIMGKLNAELQPGETPWEPQQVQAAIWVAAKAHQEGTTVEESKFDYSDSIEKALAQVSWESIPGRTSGLFPEMFDAPLSVRADYHVSMSKAFLDDDGNDIIAKRLGIMSPGEFEAPGYFEGRSNPGSQTKVVTPRRFKGPTYGDVEPAAKELIDAYAVAKGILLRQDAMAWHRPWFSPKKKDANGVEVRIKRPFTSDETVALADALAEEFGTRDIGPIGAEQGVRLLNLDYLGIPNAEFQKKVAAAVDRVFEGTDVTPERVGFAWTGNYISNNWQESPNGEEYLQNGLEGRPDLQRKVRDIVAEIRPRVEAVNDEFAAKYGWTDNRTSLEGDGALTEVGQGPGALSLNISDQQQQTGGSGGPQPALAEPREAPVDERIAGRLQEDIEAEGGALTQAVDPEGRELTARFVVGLGEGNDGGLSMPQVERLAKVLADVVGLGDARLTQGAAGAVRFEVGNEAEGQLKLYMRDSRKYLGEGLYNDTFRHETGHVVDYRSGLSRTLEILWGDDKKAADVEKEMVALSKIRRPHLWGETDEEIRERVGPSFSPDFIRKYRMKPEELFADAVAFYSQNPTLAKQLAPNATKFIRDVVNPGRIRKVLAFTEFAGMSLAGALAAAMAQGYGSDDEEVEEVI